jgi:hypothetical protein
MDDIVRLYTAGIIAKDQAQQMLREAGYKIPYSIEIETKRPGVVVDLWENGDEHAYPETQSPEFYELQEQLDQILYEKQQMEVDANRHAERADKYAQTLQVTIERIRRWGDETKDSLELLIREITDYKNTQIDELDTKNKQKSIFSGIGNYFDGTWQYFDGTWQYYDHDSERDGM